jgi:hypothetical protein
VTTYQQLPLIFNSQDFADRIGVKLESIHRYRNRGAVPNPDGYFGRSPYWFADTVEQYVEQRQVVEVIAS